jgi:predicted Zn finger-like uncharacterized protein
MIIRCESCQSTFMLDSSLVKPTGSKVRCSKCGKTFKVYPPQSIERRKHPRVKTSNLISYYSFNETGKLISHGLGVTADISKGGMLLETPCFVESGPIVLTAIDWEKNLVQVKGKLIYSVKQATEMYRCGIEFVGINERVADFIVNLIKNHSYQGYNLFIAIGRKIQDIQSQKISG